MLCFDGPLPLGSRRGIQSEFIRWAKGRPSVRSVIFVASTLYRLESGEADTLVALIAAVRDAGYRVALASVTDEALETLGRSGLADIIGLESIVASEYLAITSLHAAAHEGLDEPTVPSATWPRRSSNWRCMPMARCATPIGTSWRSARGS